MAKRKSGDVTIRLDVAERKKLEAVAAGQHLPISTWLRQLALRAAGRLPVDDMEERQKRVERAIAALGSLSSDEAEQLRESVRRTREDWDRGRR